MELLPFSFSYFHQFRNDYGNYAGNGFTSSPDELRRKFFGVCLYDAGHCAKCKILSGVA